MNEPDFLRALALGSSGSAPVGAQQSMAAFTLRSKIVEHPRFANAIQCIGRIHWRGRVAGVSDSMLLVAQTGSGKTTALRHYVSKFPIAVEDGITRVPVLLVVTPESPSVKDFTGAILSALGDPFAHKGTASVRTARIIALFKQCGVQLMLVDEFQHFFDSSRVAESRRVADWLKVFIDHVGVPVVLVGLPRAIQVVNLNPQLRRRFSSPFYMEPFSFDTAEDRLEFRGLLMQLQGRIPQGSIDTSEANMARRFFVATNGLMDYVVKIFDDAASRAGSGPGGMLTMVDYSRAFKRVVWSAVPDSLNPFAEHAVLRPLTMPSEPFDILDDINQYISRGSTGPDAAGRKTKAGKGSIG